MLVESFIETVGVEVESLVEAVVVENENLVEVNKRLRGAMVEEECLIPARLGSNQHEHPQGHPLVEVPLFHCHCHQQTSEEKHVCVLWWRVWCGEVYLVWWRVWCGEVCVVWWRV